MDIFKVAMKLKYPYEGPWNIYIYIYIYIYIDFCFFYIKQLWFFFLQFWIYISQFIFFCHGIKNEKVIATIQLTVLTLFLAMLITVSQKKNSRNYIRIAVSKKTNGKKSELWERKLRLPFFFIMWQKQASIYPSIDYIKIKKCRVEIWFFPLVVDWMQADLNLHQFKKGEEFKWTKLEKFAIWHQREVSISLEDGVVQYVNSEIKTKFTNETRIHELVHISSCI